MRTGDTASGRHLSAVDAGFLYLERKEIPLHIAGVLVFDGPIPFERFVRRLDAKLDAAPRYRQIVVAPRFNLGYPSWEDDPRFDIRRHVFHVHLEAPGGQTELEALSGRILSELMDRRKPLWDIHVIDGLEGGRGAIIIRLHHALVDGIAGLAILNVFLDPSPDVTRFPLRKIAPIRRRPAPPPSLADAITNGLLTSLDHFILAERTVLEFIGDLLGERKQLQAVAPLLQEVLGAVERLPFNRPCGGNRKFCWAEFDFAEVQAIRAAAGGTVNDVVLTALTRAIARYVELHGQTVTKRLVRIVCPVNLRQEKDDRPGNQLSFMPVVLPLDVENPVRMLQVVTGRTAAMKDARAADFVALAAACLGVAPPPVQALMWRGMRNVILPVPLLNMICTNMPWTPEPLYCMGRRMLALYPQVPTGYELGINCAVLTYCGKMFFGLIADADVAPDVTLLRDFLRVSFEELCVATGVREAAHRTKAKRRPRSAGAKPAAPAVPAATRKRRERAKLPEQRRAAAAEAAPQPNSTPAADTPAKPGAIKTRRAGA